MTGTPRFVSAGGNTGPIGEEVASAEELLPGDVVQLADGEGDFYHTLLVSGRREGEVLMAAHSIDAFDRPLSEYRYASARYLRLFAVRIDLRTENCFPALIEGRALPSV